MFSDLHTGNYGPHNTLIRRMTEKINALEADLVVNGGDVVNTNARELSGKDMPPSHRSAAATGSIRFSATTISDSTCGNAPVSAQSKALNYWKKNKPGWDGTC